MNGKKPRIPGALIPLLAGFILLVSLVMVAPSVFAETPGRTGNQQLYGLFEQVFEFIQRNYVDEVDADKLMEGALKGMFESLGDPHSAYLTADDMRSLTDTTSGEFGGVGLFISKQDPKEVQGRSVPGYVEVIAPIEGTPAFKAGILSGDLIIKVEGEATGPLDIDQVVNKLRGPVGSSVKVTFMRGDVQFDATLTRAIIQIPTVRWEMLDQDTAFLRILQWTPHTALKVEEAVTFFKKQGYRDMIIDLRGNPGGLLSSVIDVADLFFDGGLIVSTKSRLITENQEFHAKPGSIVPANLPIVVLIDNGSASASEIFAGVLKDRSRATLIGTTTYGKGSVQQVRRLGLDGFRLTMSRYFTPSGVTIDKVGVAPHIEIKEPELTDAQKTAYGRILQAGTIAEFVKKNPSPNEAALLAFIKEVRAREPETQDLMLRRMVRAEINRHLSSPPLFDLEYDMVLKAAINHLAQAAR